MGCERLSPLARADTLPAMNSPRSAVLSMAALILALAGCATHSVSVTHTDEVFDAAVGGRKRVTYRLKAPADAGLPVESGGYFHPVTTPSGVVVTDLAPSDHRHHRGIFLAWVEMHGAKDADFWGWGEHAPVKGRRIVNRRIDPTITDEFVSFRADNDWMADDVVLVQERLDAKIADREGVRVIDLTYRLTPPADLTLSRWAFSGFCVRVRKDGDIRLYSPSGPANYPAPSHVQPGSDWPDARWYACEQTLPGGSEIGVAVINHPDNPPTLWHNHPDIRMINPCIVAPSEVRLKAGKPLVLKYRVVTFDGKLPRNTVQKLAFEL
jgi:hypothetical protein